MIGAAIKLLMLLVASLEKGLKRAADRQLINAGKAEQAAESLQAGRDRLFKAQAARDAVRARNARGRVQPENTDPNRRD